MLKLCFLLVVYTAYGEFVKVLKTHTRVFFSTIATRPQSSHVHKVTARNEMNKWKKRTNTKFKNKRKRERSKQAKVKPLKIKLYILLIISVHNIFDN